MYIMDVLNTEPVGDLISTNLWQGSSHESCQCHANLEIPNFIDVKNNITQPIVHLSCKLS